MKSAFLKNRYALAISALSTVLCMTGIEWATYVGAGVSILTFIYVVWRGYKDGNPACQLIEKSRNFNPDNAKNMKGEIIKHCYGEYVATTGNLVGYSLDLSNSYLQSNDQKMIEGATVGIALGTTITNSTPQLIKYGFTRTNQEKVRLCIKVVGRWRMLKSKWMKLPAKTTKQLKEK